MHVDNKYFVEQISNILDKYRCYENIVVIGDFNAEPNEKKLSPLIEDYNFYNLIKTPLASSLPRDAALI